jgi:hypothetical protein
MNPMKSRALLSLSLAAPIAFAIAGCGSDGSSDSLLGRNSGFATDPDSLAGGPGATFSHQASPVGADNGLTDPIQKAMDDQAVGSPEVVARMHGTQKVQYVSLGNILTDLGVNLTNQTAGSAGSLYKSGVQALGTPNYANRVPEQIVPSTSSLAKEFDIFTAAAPEVIANIAMSKRCPGVVLVTNNQFSADGISCLIGKPARPEHIALANQLVTEATTPQLGIEIAVATLLAAAHTSE